MPKSVDRSWLLLFIVLGCLLATATGAIGEEPDKKVPRYAPTSEYEIRDVLGWKIYWRRDLDKQPELAKQVEAELHNQLYRTSRVVPAEALAKIRQIPIWMEVDLDHAPGANYHPDKKWVVNNGLNPEKANCVEITKARNFVRWTISQPWVMLHELAHGYHDQFLEDGFNNKSVKDAYLRAKAGDLYQDVLRYNGKQTRHYALTNQKEYFAEATEAYYGANDYFPFNRAELKAYDPVGAEAVKQAWNVKSKSIDQSKTAKQLPWDLAELSNPPAVNWGKQRDGVRELLIWTEPFGNVERAEVFGYYSTPGILKDDESLDKSLPGIVLVHGGGGQAFAEWTKMWAARGYAAIALDYGGAGRDKKPLKQGGPPQDEKHKFGNIDKPHSEQWPYHAVANTVRAHSLLLDQPEVDSDRTAITGISWGGYLTNIVAGLDDRFNAAVPVYGCGFLQDGSAWSKTFANMTAEQRAKWHKLWDPSRYVGNAQMPMLFINGTNDFAYWLPCYAKTYQLVNGERNLRITVGMKHSHPHGWAPQEIDRFVAQHLNDGPSLPKFGPLGLTDAGVVFAALESKTPIKSTEFHWTTDSGDSPQRKWQSKPVESKKNEVSLANLPKDVTGYLFTATDANGMTVSSEVMLPEAK